jgi:hypothetical protein
LNKSASPAESHSLSATARAFQFTGMAKCFKERRLIDAVFITANSKGGVLARLHRPGFLRQTIGLGGGQEHIAGEANQLAGNIDKNRLVLMER